MVVFGFWKRIKFFPKSHFWRQYNENEGFWPAEFHQNRIKKSQNLICDTRLHENGGFFKKKENNQLFEWPKFHFDNKW